MITVSDVIKNSSLSAFPVVCGCAGLESEVIKTGIIDYEFSIEGFFENNKPFGYGDFLVASLMFTNGDESELLKMVEQLIALKVSGLAIKNIFFKKIPQSIIDLCNNKDFPIVLFDNSLYFEEIITEIDNIIQVSDWIKKIETKIELLYLNDLERDEVGLISKEMRISPLKYSVAFCLSPNIPLSSIDMTYIINSYNNHSYRDEKSFLYKYREFFLIILISNRDLKSEFEKSFFDILNLTGIKISNYTVGTSSIHNPVIDLDFCIKEAIWSHKVAKILSEERKNYSDLGTWSIIISNQQSKHINQYMKNYLNPITHNPSDSSKELIKTAIAYIKCEGNPKLTADNLFIHENTVRYRMNKLREKLDPNANDFIFYENLSLAIKIHLLNDDFNS